MDFKMKCSERNGKYNTQKAQILTCTKDLTFKTTVESVNYSVGNMSLIEDPRKQTLLVY